ncbi:hypothetical protein [Kiloniella antarctica]|uniref:Uncharacterized protein n=1 Tax=Kiloniella antarctica TaxID=1550907 RepID=A0ABW5BM11_9PROT
MTETQMALVPKVATDEMQNIKLKFTCGGQVTYQDIYDAMIQASPNAGKVTPERVEAIAKIVASVGCKNCREKWQLYRDDAVEIIKELRLEVQGE